MQGQLSVQQVIQSYQALSSNNFETKRRANNFLITLLHKEQAWMISRELIVSQDNQNYQVLGSQVLYQKVSQQLQGLTPQFKTQLRDFILALLQNQSITSTPLIDKLSSSLALVVCTMFLQQWNSFVTDLMGFMKNSPNCLKNGLFILERIPEQLRNTNRIALGLKKVIINQFIKFQENMTDIFLSVLKMDSSMINPQLYKQLIKRDLITMESWSKSGFSFLKYPELIKQILTQSLQDFDKFQHAIIVIVQTIKSASANKQNMSIDSIDNPSKQLQIFSQNQVSSIKIVLQYVEEQKSNFLNFNNQSVEQQHREAFLEIIKQSLLNFGFLMLENIGFQLLQTIFYFTGNSDLKISSQTFQFWMDMSQKMASATNLPEAVRNQFSKYMIKLFDTVGQKIIVDVDYLLDDPDLKQDLTEDDPAALTFTQYRKQATIIYQYIYQYYTKTTKSPSYYFQTCFSYLTKDLAQPKEQNGNQKYYQFHKYTQFALFCIKSAQESMVSQQDSQNLRKILTFIFQKIVVNNVQTKARVASQIMLLIAECTREIKADSNLLFQCLKFSMKNILNTDLCYYASRAFKSIVESIESLNDPNLVKNLIDFYDANTFPKQTIIADMLEGIFGMIQKFEDRSKVPFLMESLVNNISNKFHKAFAFLQQNPSKLNSQFLLDNTSLLIPLLQLRTLLYAYNNCDQKQFTDCFLGEFEKLSNFGLQIMVTLVPFFLNKISQKFIPGNQLSLCISIFKSATKICTISKIDIKSVIGIMENILGPAVLANNTIIDMCSILVIFTDLLNTFMKETKNEQLPVSELQQHNYTTFNNWLINKMREVNQFFFQNFQVVEMADTDVIKWFFALQQALLIYNDQLFLSIGNESTILDLAIHCIRRINQQKMQKKVIIVLLLCCKINSQELQARKVQLLTQTFHSIPIINSIHYHNLTKIFMMLFIQIQPQQKCAEFILSLLRSNPYDILPINIVSLLAQSFHFCVRVSFNQRHLMMLCKDMQQLVINGQRTDSLLELQLRFNNWKREHNRKMKSNKGNQ